MKASLRFLLACGYNGKMTPSLFSLPSIAITGTLVWILFVFVALAWTIATLVLEYHWSNYAVAEEVLFVQKIGSMRFLYRAGSFFLLAIIFLATISFPLT